MRSPVLICNPQNELLTRKRVFAIVAKNDLRPPLSEGQPAAANGLI